MLSAVRNPRVPWNAKSPIRIKSPEDMPRQKATAIGDPVLPAGRRVYPHIDRGEYYKVRNRYHFVLRSADGSWLKAADEEVRMKEGEVWWFDNNQMHEAHNDGDQDRIHIIFDMLPSHRAAEVFGLAA